MAYQSGGVLSLFFNVCPNTYNLFIIMAYMTQEGYDKMVAQLRHMETIDRPAASAAIAEARDKGDLSENSEYGRQGGAGYARNENQQP